eukprot:scaffold683_cov124-Cylindrotheca_fusiformis.AAC.12
MTTTNAELDVLCLQQMEWNLHRPVNISKLGENWTSNADTSFYFGPSFKLRSQFDHFSTSTSSIQ